MTYKKAGNDSKGRGMNEVERGNRVLSCKLTVEPSILINHTVSHRIELEPKLRRLQHSNIQTPGYFSIESCFFVA